MKISRFETIGDRVLILINIATCVLFCSQPLKYSLSTQFQEDIQGHEVIFCRSNRPSHKTVALHTFLHNFNESQSNDQLVSHPNRIFSNFAATKSDMKIQRPSQTMYFVRIQQRFVYSGGYASRNFEVNFNTSIHIRKIFVGLRRIHLKLGFGFLQANYARNSVNY